MTSYISKIVFYAEKKVRALLLSVSVVVVVARLTIQSLNNDDKHQSRARAEHKINTSKTQRFEFGIFSPISHTYIDKIVYLHIYKTKNNERMRNFGMSSFCIRQCMSLRPPFAYDTMNCRVVAIFSRINEMKKTKCIRNDFDPCPRFFMCLCIYFIIKVDLTWDVFQSIIEILQASSHLIFCTTIIIVYSIIRLNIKHILIQRISFSSHICFCL